MPNFHIFTSPHLFLFFIILFVLNSFVTSNPRNGFSPESPLYARDSVATEKLTTLAKPSISNPNSTSNIDSRSIRFEVTHAGDFMYIVAISFGSSLRQTYNFLLDTGSHLFWTQCLPCTRSYHQLPPVFDSERSFAFTKLACENPFCRNNNSTFTCRKGDCVYRQTFTSGGITEGVVASDLINIPSQRIQIFFGCSGNNKNFSYFERSGRIGGILGLSMSPVSFLEQLADVTRRRFSYCLTPSEGKQSSLLKFGDDINTRGREFKSTSIVSPPNFYNYFVMLLDISVGDRRLNFSRNTFALKRDGNGGCMIDSGTSIARFIEPAYRKVLEAFKSYFDSYGLEQVHLPETGLELCYKNSGKVLKFATITYHFEGGDLEVEKNNVYLFVKDRDAFCVALRGAQNRTIVGSMHQVGTRFIFDVSARKILFSKEDCRLDRD